jgi:hypothetical protein
LLDFAGLGVTPSYSSFTELAHILNATEAEQEVLVVVVPVDILAVVVHVPVPSVASIVLCSTPPVAEAAATAEIAIRGAVAAREGRKTIRVCTGLRGIRTYVSAPVPRKAVEARGTSPRANASYFHNISFW